MIRVLLIMLFLPTAVTAQTPISFSSVTTVDGTKTELYKRARIWFAEAFKDSKEVIQMEDKEEGVIVGKGAMKYYSSYYAGSLATQGVIKYTVKVQVKDGRYKCDITDFIHEAYQSNERPRSAGQLMKDEYYQFNFSLGDSHNKKIWQEMSDMCTKEAKTIETSLKSYLSKTTDNDNW